MRRDKRDGYEKQDSVEEKELVRLGKYVWEDEGRGEQWRGEKATAWYTACRFPKGELETQEGHLTINFTPSVVRQFAVHDVRSAGRRMLQL